MLTPDELGDLVAELAARPGHEKVRVHLYRLLVDGLGADSRDIDFEKSVPEVHGRIDALLGRTVFELKSDLRRERKDAEKGLKRYLSEREGRTDQKYVGIATDGADFIAYFLREDRAVEVGSRRTGLGKPEELTAWLRSTVAVGEVSIPDPCTITREFGRESLAAQRAMFALQEAWTQAAQTPEAGLKRALWNRLLGLAYGAEIGDDRLFLQHTYLVVVASPEAPLVRGREGNQDKEPWKSLQPPRGTVENEFLRPVLLGESIAPFRVIRPFQAAIPWDGEQCELMDAGAAAKSGYRRLARWLQATESLWDKHKGSELSLLEQCDYYGKLSCQFPIAPVRVVYTKAGTNLAAAVVEDLSAIIDHKLYWGRTRGAAEAHYLCGILNSEVLRTSVAPYQAQGQWGARDFDKYVFNLPIPRFRQANALHRRLALAARRAAAVASDVPLKEGEYFTRSRKRIRDALALHGVAKRLEELVAELLEEA